MKKEDDPVWSGTFVCLPEIEVVESDAKLLRCQIEPKTRLQAEKEIRDRNRKENRLRKKKERRKRRRLKRKSR